MFRARLYLLLCVVFWGWSFVATRICLEYVSPIELVALRFAIGLPVLFTVVKIKRVPFRFDRNQKLWLIAGGAVLLAHFIIQTVGLKYTSATNTGWIISVTPLVMAVLAFLFLRERLSLRAIGGIILATIGILLLVSRGNLADLGWLSSYGDWLVLASAHTWALYTVATRNVARSVNPLAVTVMVFLPVAVVTLLYTSFTSDWGSVLDQPWRFWTWLLYLGVAAHALAHWFWQEGVASLGAARAGIYLYLEPIATTALAVPLLAEYFGVFSAVGGALVLVGVFWAERRKP